MSVASCRLDCRRSRFSSAACGLSPWSIDVRACGCVPDTIVATITAGRRPGSLHDSDFYGRGGRQAQLATQKMTALEGKAPADLE